MVVALIGVGAAGYLSFVEGTGDSPVCLTGGRGCQTVAANPYSDLLGVRVSYVGLAGLLGMLAAALLRSDLARVAGATMALAGAGFSLYLTYVELFVIDAVCEYCLLTATTVLTVAVLSVLRAAGYCDRDVLRRLAPWCAAAAALALGTGIAISEIDGPEGEGPPQEVTRDERGEVVVRGSAAVRSELQGLTQRGTVIGDQDAPVTVTEYGDLQCPLCAVFALDGTPELLRGPVADGAVKVDFRNWAIFGPESQRAARAALAAAEQDRMWQFVSLFYRNQGSENTGYVDDPFLTALAREAGLDLARWDRDREAPRWDAELDRIDADARDLGFEGTPGFLVSGPGGSQTLIGVPTGGELDDAIAEAAG